MKKITIPLLLGTIGLIASSCQDIANIQNSEEGSSQSAAAPEQGPYPFTRNLTDVQGRSIEATIEGKERQQLALTSRGHQFIIPLEKLSREDQNYLSSLSDGGRFQQVSKLIEQRTRLSGRRARWHLSVENAEREAAQLGLPLLLAILITGNEESDNLEKSLMFSRELKDWSNTNLVLAAMKVDDPFGSRTTSYDAVENREIAAKYGVAEYQRPSLLLVQPDEEVGISLPFNATAKGDAIIDTVSTALSGGASWANWEKIIAVNAPEKERARVNGGPVFVGGGGGGSGGGSA